MAEDFPTEGGKAASSWWLAARLNNGIAWPVAVCVAGQALLLFQGTAEDKVRAVPEACPSCGVSRASEVRWDPVAERIGCSSCGSVEDAEQVGYPLMCVDDEVYVYVGGEAQEDL